MENKCMGCSYVSITDPDSHTASVFCGNPDSTFAGCEVGGEKDLFLNGQAKSECILFTEKKAEL